MKKYGLIGYPLSHSFSKQYFTDKFKREMIPASEYHIFPIEHISELRAKLNQPTSRVRPSRSNDSVGVTRMICQAHTSAMAASTITPASSTCHTGAS